MEYIEMAAPVNLSYHNAKRELAIQNSRDRQLSIDQTSYRQQHPNPRPPQNPTGGGFQMSFINPNQLDKVLQVPVASRIPPAFGAGYRGGVLNKNRGTLSALLRQRSDDIVNQEMLKQGLPPMEGAPVESLDPAEAVKLQLAQSLQEANYYATASQEPGAQSRLSAQIYLIAKSVVQLYPVLSQDEYADIIGQLKNILQLVEDDLDNFDPPMGKTALKTANYANMLLSSKTLIENLIELLQSMMKTPDAPPEQKKKLSKVFLSQVQSAIRKSLAQLKRVDEPDINEMISSASSITSTPMFSPSVFGRQSIGAPASILSTQSGRLSLGAPSGMASTQGNRGTYSEF